MITREQAEKMFHEYVHRKIDENTEVRNITVEEIASDKILLDCDDSGSDAQGAFDLEDRAYKCTYESRFNLLHLFKDNQWSYWSRHTMYVVEPKPGPYLIS